MGNYNFIYGSKFIRFSQRDFYTNLTIGDYEKIYLMSEMGSGEYKDRILKFGDSPLLWKQKIKAAAKSYGFNGIIKHYNPNGLTCIDYLEEIEGEYFKMASSIRDIYDSLNQGVAVVAIQKKESSKFARGGESTAGKSRLYLSYSKLICLFLD